MRSGDFRTEEFVQISNYLMKVGKRYDASTAAELEVYPQTQ